MGTAIQGGWFRGCCTICPCQEPDRAGTGAEAGAWACSSPELRLLGDRGTRLAQTKPRCWQGVHIHTHTLRNISCPGLQRLRAPAVSRITNPASYYHQRALPTVVQPQDKGRPRFWGGKVTSVVFSPSVRSAFSVSPIRTRRAASAASCLPCFLLCAVTAGNQRPPTFAW